MQGLYRSLTLVEEHGGVQTPALNGVNPDRRGIET